MRIALCISGQTRVFNEHNESEGKDLAELLEFWKDYSVDIYGVHWKSCKPINRTKFDYKKVKVIDHKDVKNWVREDFMNRCFRSCAAEVQITQPNFVEEGLNLSVRSYSQHWSAFECYNLVDNPDDYDWIVRWRWDNHVSIKDKEYLWPQWHIKLDNYMTRIFDAQTQDNSFTLAQGDTKWHADMNIMTTDDIFYMHNSNALKALQKTPFPILLERIIDLNSGNNHMRNHTLWTEVFHRANVGVVLTGLPPIFLINRHGSFAKQNTNTGV